MSYLDEIFGKPPPPKAAPAEAVRREAAPRAAAGPKAAASPPPRGLADASDALERALGRMAEDDIDGASQHALRRSAERRRSVSPIARGGGAGAVKKKYLTVGRGLSSDAHTKRDFPAADGALLQRASKLAAVAAALDSIDLEALALAHQKAGGSGLDAAAAAAAALNAAIVCAVGGDGADAAHKAHKFIERRRRDEKHAARRRGATANSSASEAERHRLREDLEAQHQGVALRKVERLREDADRARESREERASANRSRRAIAEARARFAGAHAGPARSYDNPYGDAVDFVCDEPLLARARAMCAGAESVVQSLLQSSLLQQTPHGVAAPASPPPPAFVISDEEAALVARATALLADYNPEAHKAPRKPGVASNFDPSRSSLLARQILKRDAGDEFLLRGKEIRGNCVTPQAKNPARCGPYYSASAKTTLLLLNF